MTLPMYKQKEKAAPQPKKSRQGNAQRFVFSGNKVFFISLGCPRNLVDTEVMIGILLKAGYEAAKFLEESDYIVINTCGFLEASRQESLDTIQEAFDTRKKGAKVIVTGCMVQNHSAKVKERFPQIDYMLGSGDVEAILQAVQSEESGDRISSAKSYLEAAEVPRTLSTPRHYAYLKIAEGCRKGCAYCIIPKIKGPLKSKPEERILQEFRALRAQGVQEIILIAQDLGDWGKDRGFKKSFGLIHLLQEILKEDGDYWLRLLYLYPDEITDELIQLIKNDTRICRYLDMPIQHINDDVLKGMYRTTSKKEIYETIEKLRKEIPDITIRTSLIVGFPGETEGQFSELASFVQEVELDNVGIFTYSQEPDSPAGKRTDQVPQELKEHRYQALMNIQQQVVLKKNRSLIGKKLVCVVEGYHPETKLLMTARHAGQCPEIDGQVLINDGRKVSSFGERYLVEVTETSDYDLIGKVVSSMPV